MAITKPIQKKESVDQFINNAPDGDKQRKGVKKGKREQISLTIPPDLLERLDTIASRLALSRAGMINLAIVRAIEQEEKNK